MGKYAFLLVLTFGFLVSFGLVAAESFVVKGSDPGSQEIGILVKEKPVKSGRMAAQSLSSSSDYSYMKVSREEYELMKSDPNLQVIESKMIHAFLAESVPLVNATSTWQLVSGSNLTGSGETVCIIDTWINFSHPDLLGKNKTCVIDCYNKNCVEDCSLSDSSSHGTHVAGIVGASGGINGVAKNVSMIGLKVLNALGTGSGDARNVSNAIDWCVNNRDLYNISVISLSLGTSELYPSACDISLNDGGLWSGAVNRAFAKNISVVVASGNEKNFTHIAAPACLANATAVGMTYDKDFGSVSWTNSSGGLLCSDSSANPDHLVCWGNRNSLVRLVAPGAIINSTVPGGYSEKQGTSMAAPHVAGAIAIINQLLRSVGESRTPSEIVSALYNTGKIISDTGFSNVDYSRIDIYSAVVSLDDRVPSMVLSPSSGTVNTNRNQTFQCNSSDLLLKNLTFYLWNSTGLFNQTNLNLSQGSYNFSLALNNLPFDSYNWSCEAYDFNGNRNLSSNNSLIVRGVSVALDYPATNNYTRVNETNFSCSAITSEGYALTNLTFYLWNSTGLEFNQSANLTGNSNSSVFNYSFLREGEYSWGCEGVNNASSSSSAGNNSITYDVSAPLIVLGDLPGSQSASYVEKKFYFNVSEIANCSLIVNDLVVDSKNGSGAENFSRWFSPGTFVWKINCSDLAGNFNSTENNQFTISAIESSSGSGGGGGGGGYVARSVSIVPEIFSPSQQEVSNGYSHDFKSNDLVKIVIFDENAENHTIMINNVTNNSVYLTVMSTPIPVVLGIGQSIKLNLTSPDYYNLFIELNSINNSRAKLTIQTIHDKIFNEVVERNISASEREIEFIREFRWDYLLYCVIGIVIIAAIVLFILDRMERRRIRKELLREIRKKKLI